MEEPTMDVWPQSTSKVSSSTVPLLRIPITRRLAYFEEAPLSFQRCIKQSQVCTSRSSSNSSPAHSIRRNGLPLQRLILKAFFSSESSTARTTFSTSYAAYRISTSLLPATDGTHHHHTLQDITAFFPIYYQHPQIDSTSRFPQMASPPLFIDRNKDQRSYPIP